MLEVLYQACIIENKQIDNKPNKNYVMETVSRLCRSLRNTVDINMCFELNEARNGSANK